MIYIYFVYFSVYTTDGLVTEMSAVRDLSIKLDSKTNIIKLHTELLEELNKQLFMEGLRVNNIIIKNFILLDTTKSNLDVNTTAGINYEGSKN